MVASVTLEAGARNSMRRDITQPGELGKVACAEGIQQSISLGTSLHPSNLINSVCQLLQASLDLRGCSRDPQHRLQVLKSQFINPNTEQPSFSEDGTLIPELPHSSCEMMLKLVFYGVF